MNQLKSNKIIGMLYAISGAVLWGVSGTIAQYLFATYHPSPVWLVGIRLLFGGLVLLLWSLITEGRETFAIFRHKKDTLALILFGLLGMMPSQLCYFSAVNASNAPTATVLQNLGPLFIIIFVALANHSLPRQIDTISIIIALFGTFMLATNGQFTHLALTPKGMFWGILAGVATAVYTLMPRRLLRTYDAKFVIGWAMLIGSLPFTYNTFTNKSVPLTPALLGWISIVVVVGTALTYLLYLKSLQYLAPTTTGMLGAFEPLTATVLAVTILGTPLTLPKAVGGILILLTTFLQALGTRRSRMQSKN
ncbi:EamA family transporter [Lactobacillus sp. CC-MHH1034]|uniref:DMT family transporter n=1 Tax=Agrilactobacillus fermenti TaxID=2586909 RepID=UPI001E387CA9|nr:DMT family transporter [Agrilactobacillus fermenti]MCD2255668.1 EamA family transporter [Agrilactobacillus fermenti]